MDDQELAETIARLDREVPKTDAAVRFDRVGDVPREHQIIATRNGLLRLGIELLKAALDRTYQGRDPNAVVANLTYLITRDSAVSLVWFQRHDQLPAESKPPPTPGVWAVLPLVLCVALAVVGVVALAKWLW